MADEWLDEWLVTRRVVTAICACVAAACAALRGCWHCAVAAAVWGSRVLVLLQVLQVLAML